MRIHSVLGFLFVSGLSATTLMAQPPQGREGGREGDRRRGEAPPIVRALDANEDGQISAEELKNATKALQSLDANNDGVLTEEEFGRPRGEGGRGGFGGPGGFNPMAQFDKDGDGKLSKEEAPDRMKENFDRMDINKDGFIDQTDFAAMRERFRGGQGGPGRPGGQGGPGGDFESRMKEMDKDGDGKISKEEAPDRMKENFDNIDTNKDGFVDEAEIRQLFERFRGGNRPPREGDRPREGGDRPRGDRPREGGDRPKAEFE